jgi:hypothetical protein
MSIKKINYDKPSVINTSIDALEYMPKYKDIPEEFMGFYNNNKWNKVVTDWFFTGIENIRWSAKPGIDINLAIRQLRYIMSSWSPKHEHKEAAVAYLMSLWFDDVSYTLRK